MKIQIKNRYDHAVIFETDAATLGDAAKAAVALKISLNSANLNSANLSYANLSYANLSYADLSYANLNSANLNSANLRSADLNSADLSYANLNSANLNSANLSYANLNSANLRSADLNSANLSEIKISSEELAKILATRTILIDGDIIGWKKLADGSICKLKIPAEANRVGGLVGRKCRAEYAEVLSGSGKSIHDANFIYEVGKIVSPNKFDPNPLVECSHGIHFYITKTEAEAHT